MQILKHAVKIYFERQITWKVKLFDLSNPPDESCLHLLCHFMQYLRDHTVTSYHNPIPKGQQLLSAGNFGETYYLMTSGYFFNTESFPKHLPYSTITFAWQALTFSFTTSKTTLCPAVDSIKHFHRRY